MLEGGQYISDLKCRRMENPKTAVGDAVRRASLTNSTFKHAQDSLKNSLVEVFPFLAVHEPSFLVWSATENRQIARSLGGGKSGVDMLSSERPRDVYHTFAHCSGRERLSVYTLRRELSMQNAKARCRFKPEKPPSSESIIRQSQ